MKLEQTMFPVKEVPAIQLDSIGLMTLDGQDNLMKSG